MSTPVEVLLESQIDEQARHRGKAYFYQDRVSVVAVSDDNVEAIINEHEEHRAQMQWSEDGELKTNCTCSDFAKSGPCRHLWALALKCRSLPFGSSDQAFRALDEQGSEFGMDSDYDDRDFDFGGRRDYRTIKSLVASVQDLFEAGDGVEANPRVERQLWFQLRSTYEYSNSVSVYFCQSELGRAGRWGRVKSWHVSRYSMDRDAKDLDARDQKLLQHLMTNHVTISAGEQSRDVLGFVLPMPAGYEVLNALIGMGRLVDEKRDRIFHPISEVAWKPELKIRPLKYGYSLKMTFTHESSEFDANMERDILYGPLINSHGFLAPIESEKLFQLYQRVRSSDSVFSALDWYKMAPYIGQIIDLTQLELPEELAHEVVSATPKAHIRLSHLSVNPDDVSTYFNLEFEYASTMWTTNDPDAYGWFDDAKKSYTTRDFTFEEQARADLLEGLKATGAQISLMSESAGTMVAKDLSVCLSKLVKLGWTSWIENRKAVAADRSDVHVRSSGMDWFDVEAEVELEGTTLPIQALLQKKRLYDQFLQLSDGRLLIVSQKFAEQTRWIERFAKKDKDGKFSISRVQLLWLNSADFELSKDVGELVEQLNSLETHNPSKAPERLKAELRTYQQVGLEWLKKLNTMNLGGCLADEMGLGKTIQVISLMLQLKSDEKLERGAMVVVPKSLVYNWQREIEQFAPELKVLEYSGKERQDNLGQVDFDILIMTYHIMSKDIDVLKDWNFDYLILDEAQAIKNPSSLTRKAAKLIQAENRLTMTGTPVENHISDLVTIFDFLNPGLFGEVTQRRLMRTGISDLSGNEVRLIAKTVKPLLMRRMKTEVLSDLPDKQVQVVYCDMAPEQKTMYEQMLAHVRQKSTDSKQTSFEVLEHLLRLRQIACHSGLLDESRVNELDGKLEVLLAHLEDLMASGERVLVFSQFVSFLKITSKHLEQKNIKTYYLDGQTRDRAELIDRFQSEKQGAVFLISLKSGGVGLNLTNASYCFILDPWWNPAIEDQAIDRAHRIGQTKKVNAYRLISRGTVEQKVLELQGKKNQLVEQAVNGSEAIGKLDQGELTQLLF